MDCAIILVAAIALFWIPQIVLGINGEKIYPWNNLIKSLFVIPYYKTDGKVFLILIVGWTIILEVYEHIVF